MTMDLSPVTDSLPDGVAMVAVEGSSAAEFRIFPEEEALVSHGAVPSRTSEFRLGRHAAHLAMDELGLSPQPVLRGPERQPIWPEGLVGSIAHAGDIAVAAVGRGSATLGIGVDLEGRGRYFPDLEDEIAVEEERVALGRLDGQARRDRTIELFSAKESVFKALHPRVGEFFGFDAVRVEFEDGHLVAHLLGPLGPFRPGDRPMSIGRHWFDDHVLTWLILPSD